MQTHRRQAYCYRRSFCTSGCAWRTREEDGLLCLAAEVAHEHLHSRAGEVGVAHAARRALLHAGAGVQQDHEDVEVHRPPRCLLWQRCFTLAMRGTLALEDSACHTKTVRQLHICLGYVIYACDGSGAPTASWQARLSR